MITIDSKLVLVTGLHIGGADDSMKIGGVDSPVMKRKVFANKQSGEIGFPLFNDKGEITNGLLQSEEPYIAGSSLKGKIRSLLEYNLGLIRVAKLLDKKGYKEDNKEITYKVGGVIDSQFIKTLNYEKNYTMNDKKIIERKAELIILLFGESGANSKDITRTVFRDCFITKEVRKAYLDNRIKLTEEKYENVIDRKTGTTIGGGLRQIERVPSAVEFDFTLSIRVFDEVNRELFKNTILLGLKLLELDALGGNGSRGYGRVQFSDFKINNKTVQLEMDIEKLRKKIDNELDKSKN